MSDRLKTMKTCAHCEEPFRPWNSLQKFCSSKCANNSPARQAQLHALRGSKRQPKVRECATCGNEFRVEPWDTNWGRPRKYCSRACTAQAPEVQAARKAKLADRHGKANPNFRNGLSVGRNIRTFTLALKGEECCRNCGRPQEHLHHVLPRSFYRAGRGELLNGLPLCAKCHLGWHHRKVTIYRDVFTEEEWTYLTAVQLTGQEVVPWLDERYPERPTELEMAV